MNVVNVTMTCVKIIERTICNYFTPYIPMTKDTENISVNTPTIIPAQTPTIPDDRPSTLAKRTSTYVNVRQSYENVQ